MIGRSTFGIACLAVVTVACYPGRSVDSTSEFVSVTTLYDQAAPFEAVKKYALPDTVLYVPKKENEEVPAATQAGHPVRDPHESERARMDRSDQRAHDAGRRVRGRGRHVHDVRRVGVRLLGLLGLVPVLARGLWRAAPTGTTPATGTRTATRRERWCLA